MTRPEALRRLADRLTEAPEGRRSLLASLIRFGVTGVLSVVVDVGTLTGLHSGLSVPLFWATLVAYAAGLIVNYSLNRNWTFQTKADHRRTLIRYFTLIAFNFTSTELIVLGLPHHGWHYLIGKGIAVGLNAIINFTLGRTWVFAHRSDDGDG